MAAIVADEVAFERLGSQALDDLCHQLTGQLRQGHHTAAVQATITAAGHRLAAVLPRAVDDVNELGDWRSVLSRLDIPMSEDESAGTYRHNVVHRRPKA